jgi:hypothetical protein
MAPFHHLYSYENKVTMQDRNIFEISSDLRLTFPTKSLNNLVAEYDSDRVITSIRIQQERSKNSAANNIQMGKRRLPTRKHFVLG